MQFLFIIDPLPELKAYKDTTVTMMRAAQSRGHSVFVCEQPGIAWRAGGVTAETTRISLTDDDGTGTAPTATRGGAWPSSTRC